MTIEELVQLYKLLKKFGNEEAGADYTYDSAYSKAIEMQRLTSACGRFKLINGRYERFRTKDYDEWQKLVGE